MAHSGRQHHRKRFSRFALRLAVLTAVVFACTSLLACDRPQRLPLIIGATTLPASAPVYIAEEQGYFGDEGLDPEIQTYPAGRIALDALLNRQVDVATVAQTPLSRDVLAGKDPVIVATIAEVEGANYVVARRDRGITTAEDLRGKRIGVLKGTTADYFLHIYLVTSGIDPEDVEVVSMEEGDLVPAVVNGDLDGASAFAPYTFRLQDQLRGNAIILEEPHLYTTMWNVVVRSDELPDKRDVLEPFLRAIARASEYITNHPSESQIVVARRTGAKVSDLRRDWASHEWMVKLDQSLVLALEDEARWMLPGRNSAPPNFLDHIDPSVLESVSPAAISLVPSGDR